MFSKKKIKIRNKNLGFFISKNQSKNVILYLHGGPGSPEIPFFNKYMENNFNDFTICLPDQRGSARSFHGFEKIDLQLLIEDNISIAKYLIEEYNCSKVFLMGHSFGSYIGLKTIKYDSSYFHCYIGVGQMADQLESELITYNLLVQNARENNDFKVLKKLEKYDLNEKITSSYLMYRNELVNNKGFGMIFKVKNSEMMKLYFKDKSYSNIEKLKLIIGGFFSSKNMLNQVFTDSITSTTIYSIPVHFIYGEYDYITQTEVGLKYFNNIVAKEKSFHVIKNSSHSPIFDQSLEFSLYLKKILLNN